MFVKPKEGLPYPVLDPVTKVPLPPEGKEITSNKRWWLRRIAEGDVVEMTAADAKGATS